MRHGRVDGTVDDARSLVDDLSCAWVGELRGVETASVVDHLRGIVEEVGIEDGSLAVLIVGKLHEAILIKEAHGRMKRPVRVSQVCGLRGAYRKKELSASGCVFASRSPVIPTLYLSMKY